MSEMINLSEYKIEDYLKLIINDEPNQLESNTIDHIKEISNKGLLGPAYAIHALLKFVETGETDNLFNFSSEYYKNLEYKETEGQYPIRNYFHNAIRKKL